MRLMPRAMISGLPELEMPSARVINSSLMRLADTALEFTSAMLLVAEGESHASRNPQDQLRSKWIFIGARVGALCLYDFFQDTQAINNNLRFCPTIVPMVDMTAKREAQKLMQSRFPGFADVRTAAAHPGEVNSTPQKMEANTVAAAVVGRGFSGDGTVNISGSILNGDYTNTLEGRVVSYSLSNASVSDLQTILGLWAQTFQPVEDGTRALSQ